MKRVCAWCKIDLGAVKSEVFSEAAITHGICEKCAAKFLHPLRATLIEFLDSLAVPIVVVDSTVCVSSANKQAKTLLQKELPDIVGFLGGDVFECAYSKLPGGCGKTVHCVACTIRNTVTDTFQLGKSHLHVPAYLNQGTLDVNCNKIQLVISTEKVMDVVLLRIDKIGNN
jgi:hypothetical protein